MSNIQRKRMRETKRDEALEEIWEIRRQIANELGDDPKKWVAHYQRKQKEIGGKIYRREEEAVANDNLED